ncbi:hypothetical protein ABZS86_27565 [Streptomyces sp. NPDC005355]|uniref:hypothetical protein n=1 Tax=Streptomyces sp. NPDC005355 TaxID=3157038 RepID=UPI0033B8C6F7
MNAAAPCLTCTDAGQEGVRARALERGHLRDAHAPSGQSAFEVDQVAEDVFHGSEPDKVVFTRP